MTQITARVPDDIARQIDEAAARLNRSRAEVVRQALEYYLEDLEDLKLGIERLRDPADPILEWDDVRRELLDQDQA
jgi:transposase